MRALTVIALSAVGIIAGSAAATAADFTLSPRYEFGGPRAEPEVIYQYEPGIAMRAYWLPPWHNHHYFPHTGRRPAIGRYERQSKRHRRTRAAESYVRYWSNASAFPCHCDWTSARDALLSPERRINRIPSAPGRQSRDVK